MLPQMALFNFLWLNSIPLCVHVYICVLYIYQYMYIYMLYIYQYIHIYITYLFINLLIDYFHIWTIIKNAAMSSSYNS